MPVTRSAVGADLRHIDTWLFDLDNTLYPLESGLAGRMSPRITDFVERLTGLPRPEALALQKRYLAEHGLTLRGLMDHHGVDPDVYHATSSTTCRSTACARRRPWRRLCAGCPAGG